MSESLPGMDDDARDARETAAGAWGYAQEALAKATDVEFELMRLRDHVATLEDALEDVARALSALTHLDLLPAEFRAHVADVVDTLWPDEDEDG